MDMNVGSLFTGYGGLDLAIGHPLAWYSEVDPAAVTVLEHHHPGVVNHGDVSCVDFASVEPVDILTAGYPCQPFSTAGKRLGKNDERHLWPFVRDAISAIRPQFVVLENVRGHVTMGFADVLGDLAELGMSARWGVVRASDAGACHERARLFVIAYSASAKRGNEESKHLVASGRSTKFGKRVGDTSNTVGADGWQGSIHSQFAIAYQNTKFWKRYGPAIERWERVTNRPSPTPIVQRRGHARLNPVFVEWMMGLDEGYVTGHGLGASHELRMLGNGVVPQQARLALELI